MFICNYSKLIKQPKFNSRPLLKNKSYVSKKIGLSREQFTNTLATEKPVNPHLKSAFRLARLMNIPVEELFTMRGDGA